MLLRSVLLICSYVSIFYIALMIKGTIEFIYYKLKGMHYEFEIFGDNKTFNKIITVIIILGAIHFYFDTWGGTTQIGAFYEKSDYIEMYYVHFYYNETDVKNYRIRAKIESHVEEIGENTHKRFYYLDEVYWPNGNIISFDYEEIIPNKIIEVRSQDNNTYYVELTTVKINNK